MKPITEQRRQEIIEHAKEMLELMKSYSSNSGYSARSIQEIEIALASLTAKPEYFQWKWARDKNASWTTNPIEQLENAAAAFGGDGKNVNYRMLYTAPPVPVIKLPEKKDGEHVYHGAIGAFNAGKSAGYNECIADIEQLNSLGE